MTDYAALERHAELVAAGIASRVERIHDALESLEQRELDLGVVGDGAEANALLLTPPAQSGAKTFTHADTSASDRTCEYYRRAWETRWLQREVDSPPCCGLLENALSVHRPGR